MSSNRFLISSLVIILIGAYLALPDRESIISSADSRHIESSGQQSNNLPASGNWTLYSPDPNHIWNRLYRGLYSRTTREGREYGYDELDPLLWIGTRHLLDGPSHQQAIKLLDEFLSTNAERLISDPLRRAIFQRDLWAIFDWATQRSDAFPAQSRELRIRLVQVIRRLALTREQIHKLPDNYMYAIASKAFAASYDPDRPGTAFLPDDFFQINGTWVPLNAYDGEPVALTHVFAFSGRSAFFVLMRLPGGQKATLAYLKRLQEFPQPWIQDPQDPGRMLPNPKVPQFPVGTQLALVRRMMLIDNLGNLAPTNIVEKVQIRVHHKIPTDIPEGVNTDSNEALESLDVFEFKLGRERLFAGESGGLRATTPKDKEFPLFMSHGVDLFERSSEHISEFHLRASLRFCAVCHHRPGIHSILSREFRKRTVPGSSSTYVAETVVRWKKNRYDWGLLKGLWEAQTPPR